MDTSLPVLVTRLSDRAALARLVRAALRHEIAQVVLSEGPRKAQPHTLDLRVADRSALALLAEPVGAPKNGHFPLRLRPLHRAQAAELYALLEAENAGEAGATQTQEMQRPSMPHAGTTAPLERNPETPSPQTLAYGKGGGAEDSAPIARAMTGSAPPPVQDMRTTAEGFGAAIVPAQAAHAFVTAHDDPRRTAPSASWGHGRAPPSAPKREEVRPWTPRSPRAEDDPRRTAPSASWRPPQDSGPGAHTSAVPTTQPTLGAQPLHPVPPRHGTEPPRATEPPDSGEQPTQPPDGPSDLLDASEGTLSVSVVFEPDVLPAELREAAAVLAASPADDAPDSISVIFEADLPPATIATDTTAAADDEPFFDEALLNLPAMPLDGDDGDTEAHVGGPPVEAPSAPTDTSRSAGVEARVDPSGDATETTNTTDAVDAADALDFAPDSSDIVGPLHDDDDFETLIRLPGATAAGSAPPIPAAGSPATRMPSEQGRIVPPAARHPDELTPTATSLPAGARKQSTSSGRKRKTTRRGKLSSRSGKHGGFGDDATATRPHGDDAIEGRRIADGKYMIESLIGAGAAGAVYKATHRELRRTVAVKVLHPHYQQDPHFMKSFRSEALAASQLDHPNVMRVLDFGQESDGLVYIVMEYLSGRTLQNLLDEERRLAPDRALEIMIQVCAALSVAHDHGIIHRDIKPDNIMLVPSRNDEGGTFELVKVCDFGIAALQNPRAEDEDIESAHGAIAGTPEYMSPEQARGVEIDARSDVYAAGICLYELVTGRPPFLGENAAEILIKQLEEPPKPPSQLLRGIDPLLEEVILRAIQKDPAKRHQSARELRVELKELIDPGDERDDEAPDERSIIESVPVLDDPASGFAGFFIALSSAILRFGRFERGHPEAAQAMKDLFKATKSALRGRSELTFARRDTAKAVGFCVMSGTAEIVDFKRLLESQLYGSFAQPFIDYVVAKGIAALTLREGIPEAELSYLVETLLGDLAHDDLRKELFAKPLRHVSVLFVSDVVGRDRKLSWKVGLCAARLGRDLTALSNVRGTSLKKMREARDDLVGGVARLLTRGDEVRQFLYNVDLVESTVENLRGFSSFQLAPLLLERVLHEPCAEAAMLLVEDFDRGEIDPNALKAHLRLFATRLLAERSPKADAAVTELYKRSIVTDADVPRDLRESIRATALADALAREPSQFLRTLDMIGDPDAYARELATLEAAMSVLARRGEAGALLAVISTLARHAKGSGPLGERESHALRAMKSMIDKQRLVPVANALLVGPAHQREAARQLLVLAGSAGAHALYIAREGLSDASARPLFVKVFRETGPAGWSLLSAVLPRMEVRDDAEVPLVEDLLRAMPDRPDPVLGDAVAKFLSHPRLRPAALAAIVPLWGERARKPLIEALELAEDPARLVAITELRRVRAIDEQVVSVIERLLTMRGSASDELRAMVAAALAEVPPPLRPRAVALLSKGVEGKRGFVASLLGDGGGDESALVVEAMARALLVLDRNEGIRALKARMQRSDGLMRARLAALLQSAT